VNLSPFLLLFGSLWLAPLSSIAQTMLDPSIVLQSAIQDPQVTAQQNHLQFAKNKAPRLALIDGAHLRTESNRFELIRQEYLARLSWNGFFEQKRYRQLQSTALQTTQTQLEDQVAEALLDRYLLLLHYRSNQQLQGLQAQLFQVLQDKKTVSQVLNANSNQADPEDLYKLQFDLDKLELERMDSEEWQAQLLSQAAEWLRLPEPVQLDTSGWISPTSLLPYLQKLVNFTHEYPELLQQQAKIIELDAERRLEIAKSRQIIDFIQFRYGNRPGDPFRYAAAVSLGINLPFNSSRNARAQELRIEQSEAATELELLQLQLQEEKKQLLRELQRLQKQYQLLQYQLQESETAFAPEKLALLEKNSLLTLLHYRELQLQRQMILAETEQKMLETYLEFLYLNGTISGFFRQNFLKSGWPAY